jgi:1-acyl-sn-glycerol-3-phosphate acyltransferase
VVLQRLPLSMTWVVRDEFFDWRFVGPFLRASGQVEVCPEDGVAAYRTLLRATKDTVQRGESIVVFPQGSILGVEAAFQHGAFAAARAAGAPVLPVVITGTHRVWEHPYTPRVRFDEHVTVEILDPIEPGDLEVADLQRRMTAAALAHDRSSPRRYDPDRDGWWDGYRFDIDPEFPELAARVAAYRAGAAATSR